jgi:LSD1 subclass zinc finger protein
MTPATTWTTNDVCPACGTILTLADGAKCIRQDCPACGWTATWDGEASG